jgi:hypothetical protein
MASVIEAMARPERSAVAFAPPTDRDATAYGLAALAGEVEKVRTAVQGTRNDTLNIAAVKMGGLIAAGAIDEHTVYETLGAADGGLDHKATRDTLRSGLNHGMSQARAVPERISTWSESASSRTGVQQSDDPFAEGFFLTPSHLASTSVSPPTSPEFSTSTPATLTDEMIALEVRNQRIRRDARRILDAEDIVKTFREPPFFTSLTVELQQPDEPVAYAIDKILPVGGNALLTAQFKTGKTTFVNALTRSLADGEPFLGRFTVPPTMGRVALFNYEVDAGQYRRWLRDVGIRGTDSVVVLNLRGYRMPVTVPHVEDWIVKWLAERDVTTWIVDPFARAFTGSGTSENDNTEVGRFLDTLDVIKARAGVSELILPTHTGRAEFEQGEERSRGATRLEDWCDVRWILTKDADQTRFFSATGRDVELDEEKLTYDEATRGYVIGGGDRKWEKRRIIEGQVIAAVDAMPGINTSQLRDSVGGNAGALTAILSGMVSRRDLVVAESGRSKLYYPAGHITSPVIVPLPKE